MAAGGPRAARLAAELGDGLFATEPRPDLVEAYAEAGGSGPRYCEAPLAWAPDEDTAAQALLETSRWALTGWKVMSELPNPVNFDAASATVRTEDVVGAVRLRAGRRAATSRSCSSSSTPASTTSCS